MKQIEHWEQVYATKPADGVSWFQGRAECSLRLIKSTGIAYTASIIDVGGGASSLADDLLLAGYSVITVLDLSATALAVTKKRLGEHANLIHWIIADITSVSLPFQAYDIWHDRAVFHFLTTVEQRQAYLAAVLHALKPNGHLIIATFAEDGPLQCSGLPVTRYSAAELYAEFASSFTLIQSEKEDHHTPFGTVQKFVYCHCRRKLS